MDGFLVRRKPSIILFEDICNSEFCSKNKAERLQKLLSFFTSGLVNAPEKVKAKVCLLCALKGFNTQRV